MGGFCCCPCPDDFEEYAHPNNPIYRQCLCLRYFFHQLFSGYNAAFQRLDSRTGAPAGQPGNPSSATTLGPASSDSSVPSSETYHLVPRPPPYSQLVSRRDKLLGHIQEESQPLRRNGSSSGTGNGADSTGSVKKRLSTDSDEPSAKIHKSGSDKSLAAKLYGSAYLVTSSEDEDVCPTCLEEYTEENPKIVAKCSHHFHLSCIYEWMERSDNCPVCGKEMEFCESP
ncbi:RING/U-box superfamily protein [Rhynchospora pubera]|uniref:RING-type E3 ubiquitin transferase n=1 Tax=Rhynchospora pubera TaxID=906938 RepID=A0AAV8C1H7_9POAL|nr:RING/U-box superfamily protein [Rhynchospora pubera]